MQTVVTVFAVIGFIGASAALAAGLWIVGMVVYVAFFWGR